MEGVVALNVLAPTSKSAEKDVEQALTVRLAPGST